MDLEVLAKRAESSLLLTAPVLGSHLERFLAEEGRRIRELAKQAVHEGVKHFYWVGSDSSFANLWSGKYLLDRFSRVPSDAYPSYEFVWRDPGRLGKDSWVFLASYSGATEDTVAALRHANERGATTIALVSLKDSPMAREAKTSIVYNSKAFYLLPLTAAYLFALEYARISGAKGVASILGGIERLPEFLSRQYEYEKAEARALAEVCAEETIFNTLGTGVLYGLAYKVGLTVFAEEMRVHGSFIDTTEFRHRPVQVLDRERSCFVVLAADDEARSVTDRVVAMLEERQAATLVFDAGNYEEVHPVLAPFALIIPLQWFAAYSAFLRGVVDLDERVLTVQGLQGNGGGVIRP